MDLLKLAQPEDWERVSALSRQVLELHANWCPNAYEVVEHPYPMDFFEACIREKTFYVAKYEGTIIGYVRFVLWETNGSGSVKRKMLSIDDIGVDGKLRNQGFGQKMMSELKELAREIGCTDMQLYVDVQNENAFAFYKKCGFHVSNVGMQMKL